MTVWDRISLRMDEIGVLQKDLAKFLNTRPQTITDWKNGKTKSYQKFLPQIATFLDVPLDYLVSGQLPALPNAEISTENTYYRPIYESVSAGYGAPGDNIAVGMMPLYIYNPADVEDTICIKVSGDSMYPKIENGDIIVIHKQDTLESGEIGVVRFDDDFFVKRIELKKDAIRLISINPEYAPKIIKGPDLEQAAIVGKVIKIVKDL